jgi:hypothetical protein
MPIARPSGDPWPLLPQLRLPQVVGISGRLIGRCLGIDVDNDDQPIAHGRWLSYTKTLDSDATAQAIGLVMQRGRELECLLQHKPELLRPVGSMRLLRWLCMQKLDEAMTP